MRFPKILSSFIVVPCILSQSVNARPLFVALPEDEALPWAGDNPYLEACTVSPEVAQSWSLFYLFASGPIDDQLVKDISRVPPGIMNNYHYEPASFVPLSCIGASVDEVLYSATLETLPAPFGLDRQLKVYIVSERENSDDLTPRQIFITVRGERRD